MWKEKIESDTTKTDSHQRQPPKIEKTKINNQPNLLHIIKYTVSQLTLVCCTVDKIFKKEAYARNGDNLPIGKCVYIYIYIYIRKAQCI